MSASRYDFGRAVFHFFTTAGRHPGAVMWIALWQSLLTAGLLYLAFVMIGDFYLWIFGEALAGREPDEAEVFGRMGTVLSVTPLLSLGGALIALMAQGAWLRLLTRGEMAAIFPFRIGSDELRLLVTNLGLLAVFMVFYFVNLSIVLSFGFGAAVFVASDGGGVGTGIAGGIGVFLFFLLVFGLAIFVSVRLSAAPALTISERRIAFPSWEATKGNFWRVLVAYILVGIMMFILSSFVGTFLNFALLGALWPVFQEVFQAIETGGEPDAGMFLASIGNALSSTGIQVSIVAATLLSLLLRAVLDAIWHSVGAYTAIVHTAPEASD